MCDRLGQVSAMGGAAPQDPAAPHGWGTGKEASTEKPVLGPKVTQRSLGWARLFLSCAPDHGHLPGPPSLTTPRGSTAEAATSL